MRTTALEHQERMGYGSFKTLPNTPKRITAQGVATDKAIPIHFNCPSPWKKTKGNW